MLPPLILLFLLLAGSVAFFSYRNMKQLLLDEHFQRLEHAGMVLLASLPEGDEDLLAAAHRVCQRIGKEGAIRITFVDPSGTVFADSHEDPDIMENHRERKEIAAAFKGLEARSLRESPTLSIPMLYQAFPIKRFSGEVSGVLRMSTPAAKLDRLIAQAGVYILLITLLLLSITIMAMVFVIRKITVPLSRIAVNAAEYARFDFTRPIYTEGPLEIATMADALQSMAKALTSRIGEITRQKQELEAVLTGMNEAVMVLDKNLVITEINPGASKIVGLPRHGLIGKSLIQVIRNTELHRFVRKVLSTRDLQQCSLVLPVEGKEIHLQVKASSIEALVEKENGNITVQRLILVMNDISTLKNLEKIRKDFVANVSHELKTPITSIKGFVETLLDGALEDPEHAGRFLSIIKNQTNRLGNIIDDLLTLSRLEQGREDQGIPFERVSLYSAVKEAVSVTINRAAEKNTEITIEMEDRYFTWGNARLIEQALINLIDNSIKYAPEKSTVRISAETAPDRSIILRVEDNGPGIPKNDQSRIFERFYRVEKARSREMGGTGLGLAIVKHIMLSHGGMVSLESSPGKGSIFQLLFRDQKRESSEN
jgi:two-component system, OmpR family, phosphate regulon sensor histidine kinase PhoR